MDMVDLKLQRITGRNWMKFGKMDIDFPQKGLVLVQGKNTASGGSMASVGSGKTSFGEAICRTLLGVDGRFKTTKQFSQDKEGDTYISLECLLNGKKLLVEAGYKCKELSPTGDALRYTYDGKTVERGLITQTRADLSKLLGVPSLLAEWSVFLDGDRMKFNKLSQADCVDLVMSALRQPPWSQFYDASKTKLSNFRREMAVNAAAHDQAVKRANQAMQDVEDAEAALKTAQDTYAEAKSSHDRKVENVNIKLEKRQTDVKKAQKRMKEIKAELKRMEEERAARSHQIEIKIHEAEDHLVEMKEKVDALEPERDALWDKFQTANTALISYQKAADKCPTCQRPMGNIDQKRLKLLTDKKKEAGEVYDDIGLRFRKLREELAKQEETKRQLEREFRSTSAHPDVTKLSEEYEDLEEDLQAAGVDIQDYNKWLHELSTGPSDSAVVEAKTVLKTCRESVERLTEGLEKSGALVAEDREMEKVMLYWNKAFSPYGIPNMVLREAIKPLNIESRRLSAAMTGGTIEVRFNTSREMASGQEKAQLNIEVDNKLGDKELAGSSKGEAGLTNFIISETLSEVGQVSRRIGFRWYDEIVPHQDPVIAQSIYSYMKETAERLGVLVFLVDHNPLAANYADHVLIVEKAGTPSKVVGSVRWR
jgi:DNA repair exonuclease SbcCD ATPase subunit